MLVCFCRVKHKLSAREHSTDYYVCDALPNVGQPASPLHLMWRTCSLDQSPLTSSETASAPSLLCLHNGRNTWVIQIFLKNGHSKPVVLLCHNVNTYIKRSFCSIGQRPVIMWATSAVPSSILLHGHQCADIKRALHATLCCWCAALY